jgi:hypothetical protein
VRGVDDAPIRLRPYGGLVAVTSAMPQEAAEEAAVRARLERLESVEAMARAHHLVVDAVARCSVVIPFRLATIHHDNQRLLDMLRRRHAEFDATLNRLTGRVEIGVKGYANGATAPAEAVDCGTDNPGRDYLRMRRQQRDRRERAAQDAIDASERIDAALAAVAVDHRRHQPQPVHLRDDDAENVLNAAYLVETAGLQDFLAQVRQHSADALGVRVEITGPWAPYSFTDLESGDRP